MTTLAVGCVVAQWSPQATTAAHRIQVVRVPQCPRSTGPSGERPTALLRHHVRLTFAEDSSCVSTSLAVRVTATLRSTAIGLLHLARNTTIAMRHRTEEEEGGRSSYF